MPSLPPLVARFTTDCFGVKVHAASFEEHVVTHGAGIGLGAPAQPTPNTLLKNYGLRSFEWEANPACPSGSSPLPRNGKGCHSLETRWRPPFAANVESDVRPLTQLCV